MGGVNDENRAGMNQALAATRALKGGKARGEREASYPGSLRGRGRKQALVFSKNRSSALVRLALRSTPHSRLIGRLVWSSKSKRGVTERAALYLGQSNTTWLTVCGSCLHSHAEERACSAWNL